MVNSEAASDSMRMPAAIAPAPSPQASITCGSLTATQTMSSTPLARSWSATRMKLGRCWVEQVPVKAPGRPNSATLRPAKSSAAGTGAMPSGPFSRKVVSGSLSPVAIVIRGSFRRLRWSQGHI